MIYLVTGTPGAGKTSNTLWDFLNNPDFSDRPKYATFIPDFDYDNNDVTELDKAELENWRDLPKGALVLIDEADGYLPAGNGKNPPEWIREMARHRHYGIDFIIITQMASMINDFLHGLIEAHIHYHRVRGNDYTTKYRWEFLQKNPYTKTNKALGLPQKIKTDPAIFKLYRSTVMNTRRKEFPWHAVIKMGVLVSMLFFAGLFVYYWMYARHHPAQAETTTTGTASTSATPSTPAKAVSPGQAPGASTPTPAPAIGTDLSLADRVLTVKDFVPSVPSMPWSAPAYADLVRPTDFPRIAACISSRKTGCKCFTQQYTPIDVPSQQCERMVKEGWFDNWATARAQQDLVLAGRPGEADQRNANRAHPIQPTLSTHDSQLPDTGYQHSSTPSYSTDALRQSGFNM